MLTIVIDSSLEKQYKFRAPELSIPLYSTTFLKYYLSHSKFAHEFSVVDFLDYKNDKMITFYEMQPTTSEDIGEKLEKYRENQIILDDFFFR